MDPFMPIDPQTLSTLNVYFDRTGSPIPGARVTPGSITSDKLGFPVASPGDVAEVDQHVDIVEATAATAQGTANTAQAAANTAQGTANDAFGLIFSQYAKFVEDKGGDPAGEFTSGAWRTRELNVQTSISPVTTPAWASLNSATHTITLQPGTYYISASAPAYRVERHIARLYNLTTSTAAISGALGYSSSGSGFVQDRSLLSGQITLPGVTEIRLEHQCQTTKATNGFGVDETGLLGGALVYHAVMEIWRRP